MDRNMYLWLTALLVLQYLALARSDFETQCPAHCSCKWREGKQTADCKGKGYTTIPKNLHDDVQVLNLDGNYIKELSKDSFSSLGLIHLKKISLKDCKLQRIDEDAFSQLKVLTHVYLDNNNITKLPTKLFSSNDRLQVIGLSNNQIGSLVTHQFPPLMSLQKIDLSSSGLKSIDTKAFRNLGQSLGEVKLHDNLLTTVRGETFENLHGLKYLSLHNNPWNCDCHLKKFRDLVVQKQLLSTGSGSTLCHAPERNNGKKWPEMDAKDFACKPEIAVRSPVVVGRPGENATLKCKITGNPVPGLRWVLNGRIIQNNSAPLQTKNPDQIYVIEDQAIAEGGIERNYSLTITHVSSRDLGQYQCVAVNNGGLAERNITLTFTPYSDAVPYPQKLSIIIGVAAGALCILLIFIIVLCCCCRKRGKDKTGHSLNGSVLGYTDPAGEKLLPQNGTLNTMNRTNPLPKPHRTGDYHHHHGDQEMIDYGPASYVPGDRYDEYGEGRGSASNSDQTGTLSRASYHSSDPDHYPDLLDFPNRMKQHSPGNSVMYGHIPHHHGHHVPHHQGQPLHPTHLMSPPHLHSHHHMSPFQRTGTLPHNFSTGTLPHNHHPRSVSCDHSGAGYGPIVQTTHNQRPGYVTLPRRPRGSWAGQQPAQAQVPRDTPSPAFSLTLARDPIYDGVGPRTSANGSSHLDLNKSLDNAMPAKIAPRQPGNNTILLPPIPPIKEETQPPPVKLPKPSPQLLDVSEPSSVGSGAGDKRAPITQLLTVGSNATLNEPEENLAAYFEPFGSALVPCAPGARDSIASCESDSLLVAEKKNSDETEQESPGSGGSTPRQMLNGLNGSHSHSQTPPLLQTIPELEPVNDHISGTTIAKKQPPPTLPKPKKPTKVTPPAPPPKPKIKTPSEQNGDSSNSFQDETLDGSEV